jgi:hypothetical protein
LGWFIVTRVIVQSPPLTQTVSLGLKLMLLRALQLMVREQLALRVGQGATEAQLWPPAARALIPTAMLVRVAVVTTVYATTLLMGTPRAHGRRP